MTSQPNIEHPLVAEQRKLLLIDANGDMADWKATVESLTAGLWQIVTITNSSLALEVVRNTAFDAVIIIGKSAIDYELKTLRHIAKVCPKLVRVLLSQPLSGAEQAKAIDIAHRALSLTMSPEALVQVVDQVIDLNKQLYRPKVERSFAAFRELPSPPTIYRELTMLLNSDRSSISDIANVVERDSALAGRVLKVVNSAYYGLERHISNLNEALAMLGLNSVRSLALAGHLKTHYPQDVTSRVFSFEKLNMRALAVARLARQIADKHFENRAIRDQVFPAGLMIDLGMLMLAAEKSDAYTKVFNYAAKNGKPLHVVEKMAFNVTHAELGAYLLASWNIAPLVIEIVQIHCNPGQIYTEQGHLTPAGAVHIADSLIPSIQNRFEIPLNPPLDEGYMRSVELGPELDHWRDIALNYDHKLKTGEFHIA